MQLQQSDLTNAQFAFDIQVTTRISLLSISVAYEIYLSELARLP